MRVTKAERLFVGRGNKTLVSYEKTLQKLITQWSTAYLSRLQRQWVKDHKSGKVKKADYAGNADELKRILQKWYLRAYRYKFKQRAEVAIIGPELAAVQAQAIYAAEATALKTISLVQAQFYNSTREYMAKLRRHASKYGVRYISRAMRGIPGASPFQRAGVPEPPVYRFKGEPLSGQVGADPDPYAMAARAETIARTELTQAANVADVDALYEVGAKFKKWISYKDDRTRGTHKHLDGKVIPLQDDFKWSSPGKGEVSANAPGDRRLPAQERINCRCSVVIAYQRDYDNQ